MTERQKVLDHGYVELVETWGSDQRIVEAARMSTGKGFLGWRQLICPSCSRAERKGVITCEYCGSPDAKVERIGDEKLLRYLYENKHDTPFEMAGMVIEVQAPIFVIREWHRHRTQSYNEASARYAPLPDLNYIPTVERLLMGTGGSNKQAGRAEGARELTPLAARNFRLNLLGAYTAAETDYGDALSDGVPKELARLVLPVGRYSRMRASANLRNWLAFLTLRAAPAAQWEIRQYAEAVAELLRDAFPRTMELWSEGRFASQASDQ